MKTYCGGVPNYVTPEEVPAEREWKGLTSAERKTLWNLSTKPMHFAELIEAKLKEKNT